MEDSGEPMGGDWSSCGALGWLVEMTLGEGEQSCWWLRLSCSQVVLVAQ